MELQTPFYDSLLWFSPTLTYAVMPDTMKLSKYWGSLSKVYSQPHPLELSILAHGVSSSNISTSRQMLERQFPLHTHAIQKEEKHLMWQKSWHLLGMAHWWARSG